MAITVPVRRPRMLSRDFTFRNPLQVGPMTADVLPALDFGTFLGIGLRMCFDHIHGDGCEALRPEPGDVYWLRKYFLDVVDYALRVLPEMRESAGTTANQHHVDAAIHIDYEGMTETDDPLRLEWVFIRYDRSEDGYPYLFFDLRWDDAGTSDSVAIFLDDADRSPLKLSPLRPIVKARQMLRGAVAVNEWFGQDHEADQRLPGNGV